MLKNIHEYKNAIENYGIGDTEDAVSIINGVYQFVKKNEWLPGYRNNLSVDISIACYVLDIPIKEIEGILFNDDIFECVSIRIESKHDFRCRHDIINEYLDGWDNHCILDFLTMDRSYWKGWENRAKEDNNILIENIEL